MSTIPAVAANAARLHRSVFIKPVSPESPKCYPSIETFARTRQEDAGIDFPPSIRVARIPGFG